MATTYKFVTWQWLRSTQPCISWTPINVMNVVYTCTYSVTTNRVIAVQGLPSAVVSPQWPEEPLWWHEGLVYTAYTLNVINADRFKPTSTTGRVIINKTFRELDMLSTWNNHPFNSECITCSAWLSDNSTGDTHKWWSQSFCDTWWTPRWSTSPVHLHSRYGWRSGGRVLRKRGPPLWQYTDPPPARY